MYTAYGLLTPATDFTLEAAGERLQKKFPAASVTLDNGVITIAGGDWDFQLQVNAGGATHLFIALLRAWIFIEIRSGFEL